MIARGEVCLSIEWLQWQLQLFKIVDTDNEAGTLQSEPSHYTIDSTVKLISRASIVLPFSFLEKPQSTPAYRSTTMLIAATMISAAISTMTIHSSNSPCRWEL